MSHVRSYFGTITFVSDGTLFYVVIGGAEIFFSFLFFPPIFLIDRFQSFIALHLAPSQLKHN